MTHFERELLLSVLVISLAYVYFEERIVAVGHKVVGDPEKVLHEVPTRKARVYVIEDGKCAENHGLGHHQEAKVVQVSPEIVPMPEHKPPQVFELPNCEVSV